MFKYILKRIGILIPTLLGVTILIFALIHAIPGDPVEIMAGIRGLTPERHAELLAQLGLDKPLWQQYFIYLSHLIQGDLGQSFVTRTPVLDEFLARFPATVELTLSAMLVATCIGIPLGVLAALKRGTWIDHTIMGASLTGYSMPIFWWGLLLILFFSVTLGLTPVSGRIAALYYIEPITGFLLIDTLIKGNITAFASAVHHLILPAVALATIPLAMIARMTRSALLEVLHLDYIRTALAKGLSPFRVIVIHALRNALIPVVTSIGLQVSLLLAGAILTETIFSWPGIGQWLISAIGNRDYPTIQGGVLLVATVIVLVNMLVDISYGVLNPRIRHKR